MNTSEQHSDFCKLQTLKKHMWISDEPSDAASWVTVQHLHLLLSCFFSRKQHWASTQEEGKVNVEEFWESVLLETGRRGLVLCKYGLHPEPEFLFTVFDWYCCMCCSGSNMQVTGRTSLWYGPVTITGHHGLVPPLWERLLNTEHCKVHITSQPKWSVWLNHYRGLRAVWNWRCSHTAVSLLIWTGLLIVVIFAFEQHSWKLCVVSAESLQKSGGPLLSWFIFIRVFASAVTFRLYTFYFKYSWQVE